MQQGFIAKLEEDSTGKDSHKESNKQKAEEISTIRTNIVKHQLSRFCKSNATALALIFKALIRGETIYSKVQFLQDSSANSLLCQATKDSDTLKEKENLQSSPKNKPIKESSKDIISNQNSVQAPQSVQSSKTQKNQKPTQEKAKLQDKKPQDSATKEELTPESPPAFPLNIEG